MNPIPIQIPDNARLTNHLFESMAPEFLLSDLVTIALENGCFVDVGWYPEGDPKGKFIIRAFQHHWGDQLGYELTCDSCLEAARLASALAFHLNKPIQIVSQPTEAYSARA